MRNFFAPILSFIGIEVRRTVDHILGEFTKIEARLRKAVDFHARASENAQAASNAHAAEADKAKRVADNIAAIIK